MCEHEWLCAYVCYVIPLVLLYTLPCGKSQRIPFLLVSFIRWPESSMNGDISLMMGRSDPCGVISWIAYVPFHAWMACWQESQGARRAASSFMHRLRCWAAGMIPRTAQVNVYGSISALAVPGEEWGCNVCFCPGHRELKFPLLSSIAVSGQAEGERNPGFSCN